MNEQICWWVGFNVSKCMVALAGETSKGLDPHGDEGFFPSFDKQLTPRAIAKR